MKKLAMLVVSAGFAASVAPAQQSNKAASTPI